MAVGILLLPLPDGLEQEDGSRDGDVERVEAAEHGDADVRVRRATPRIGEAGGLGAHHKGGRTGHFRIVIPLGILQLGRQDADAACLEPGDDLLAGVHEFFAAIREGRRANADFRYGVPLVKTVLLGNVAARAGKGVELAWDGAKVTNRAAANAFLGTTYRKGWDLPI